MKKLFSIALIAALAFSTAACSGSASKTDENTVSVTTSSTADAASNSESEVSEEEQEEPITSEAIKNDWLDAHGVSIEPQGNFSYHIGLGSDNVDNGTLEVDCNVTISESTDGCEAGYKKVTGTFVTNIDKAGDNGFILWHSAFDRYTGTSFEFDTALTSLSSGEQKIREGAVTIENGLESYDVSIAFDSENRKDIDGTWRVNVIVTCPLDYEGCVFHVSTSSYAAQQIFAENIDPASRLYTIDEFPFFNVENHYFTYTND